MARVFVAMSGGVDSSVAAALLLEAGHDVTGVTMQLWPSTDEQGGCCSVSAVRDARRVCDLLGIPHYSLNYREAFEREVVTPFAREYAAGRTPNPCIACNDRVKFADLLSKVALQGAEYLATGHYARLIAADDGSGEVRLARAVDATKDQSYFLYRLTASQAQHTLFPVGELRKTEVRAFAERFGLPVARKAESQEACFAENGDYAPVVIEREPGAGVAGEIVDVDGRVLGRHDGLAHYTVGQRKGLGIGGLAEPLYVVALDAAGNRVVVGQRSSLEIAEVRANSVVWHAEKGVPVPIKAAVRYRMEPVTATARVEDAEDEERLVVSFDAPVSGASPGQAVVCYRDEVVVGGGVIECAS